jgi:hypothetical protein
VKTFTEVINVAEIIGISCLLRTCECQPLEWSQVIDEGSRFRLLIKRAKRMGQREELTYFVSDAVFVDIIKSYIAKFPIEVCN